MIRAIALLLALLPAAALAESVTVHRILDGDTIDVIAAGTVQRIRLANLDAPESRLCPPGASRTNGCAKCEREAELGLAAKRAAEGLLPVGSVVDLRRANGRDKYQRVLATIILPDGRDFGRVMRDTGHAAVYTGRGKRQDWCK